MTSNSNVRRTKRCWLNLHCDTWSLKSNAIKVAMIINYDFASSSFTAHICLTLRAARVCIESCQSSTPGWRIGTTSCSTHHTQTRRKRNKNNWKVIALTLSFARCDTNLRRKVESTRTCVWLLSSVRNQIQIIEWNSPMLPSPATTLRWSWKMEIRKLPHNNVFHNLIHFLMSIFDMIQ